MVEYTLILLPENYDPSVIGTVTDSILIPCTNLDKDFAYSRLGGLVLKRIIIHSGSKYDSQAMEYALSRLRTEDGRGREDNTKVTASARAHTAVSDNPRPWAAMPTRTCADPSRYNNSEQEGL